MLDIVTKNHFMQFQGKLMNQHWENDKKPTFGPDFGSFGPNLLAPPSPPVFLVDFSFVTLLEAISVCNFKKNYWTKLEQI